MSQGPGHSLHGVYAGEEEALGAAGTREERKHNENGKTKANARHWARDRNGAVMTM